MEFCQLMGHHKKAILKLPRFFIHSIFVMGVGSLRVVIISQNRSKMSRIRQIRHSEIH